MVCNCKSNSNESNEINYNSIYNNDNSNKNKFLSTIHDCQNTAIFEGFSKFYFRFRKPPIYSLSIMYVRRRSIIERTSLRVCTARPLLTVVRYTSLRLTNVRKIVVVRTVRTADFRKRK